MIELPTLLYSEVESDLRSAVRSWIADRSPLGAVVARLDETDAFGDRQRRIWRSLTNDVGVADLAVPENDGGAGASWREVAVVLEELGRAVLDVPLFTSSVLGTALARAVGCRELLAGLGDGERRLAVVTPVGGPVGPVAGLAWNGATLDGTVRDVAGILEATDLLVPVGNVVVHVEAGDARLTPTPCLDMTRRTADVEFDAVAGVVLAEGPHAAHALGLAGDVAAALLASEQLGVAEAALEMTTDYLKQRRQFGRVLGSFQALKHRLADVWTDLTQARAVARYAAACAAEGADSPVSDLRVAASLAQAVCGPLAVRAAEECVQLHGGIGFTWEHPAHLLVKRARADALLLGTAARHRRRLAHLAGIRALAAPA